MSELQLKTKERWKFVKVFDFLLLLTLRRSLLPPLVSDDGVMRGVDHRRVVDRGEISVHQLKLVHAKQRGPDGLDLDVGKVLPDAAVAAGAKWDVSELLPRGRVVVEVALGFEVHPLHPGVLQTVVNGWGDADLVADGDGVPCSGLRCASHPHHGHYRWAEPQGLLQAALQQV